MSLAFVAERQPEISQTQGVWFVALGKSVLKGRRKTASDASFTSAAAFDAVLVYNSSQSNKAVSVHTFGTQSISAGTFTLTMPANSAGTALLNIA